MAKSDNVDTSAAKTAGTGRRKSARISTSGKYVIVATAKSSKRFAASELQDAVRKVKSARRSSRS